MANRWTISHTIRRNNMQYILPMGSSVLVDWARRQKFAVPIVLFFLLLFFLVLCLHLFQVDFLFNFFYTEWQQDIYQSLQNDKIHWWRFASGRLLGWFNLINLSILKILHCMIFFIDSLFAWIFADHICVVCISSASRRSWQITNESSCYVCYALSILYTHFLDPIFFIDFYSCRTNSKSPMEIKRTARADVDVDGEVPSAPTDAVFLYPVFNLRTIKWTGAKCFVLGPTKQLQLSKYWS